MRISFKIAAIAFIMALGWALTGIPAPAADAGTAVVSISAPSTTVSPGAQFTVNITMQPNNAIAGAQFNLSFNPSLVTVNSITEGNLLKQTGKNTYFTPGRIDNTSGSIIGVAGTITDPGQTVSTAGTFAVITMTAGSANGTCALSLSNVIVGNVQAQSVPVSTVDGNIIIGNGTANQPLPPGGGGGGGGGGGIPAPRPTPSPTTNIQTTSSVDNTADNGSKSNEADKTKPGESTVKAPIVNESNSMVLNGSFVGGEPASVQTPANAPLAINRQEVPTPTPGSSSNPATVKQFSLSLLAEVVGGAFILIAATAAILLLKRRRAVRG